MPNENLMLAMMIVGRCRSEGRKDAAAGKVATDCPYDQEPEKSGWLDGWSHAKQEARDAE